MTEENSPDLTLVPDSPEPTVSLTFRDQKTGKNVLKIISVISPEDRARVEEDKSGGLLAKYVIARVLHELKLGGDHKMFVEDKG